MKKYTFLLGCLLLLPIITTAQSLSERKKIALSSNIDGNLKLLKDLENEDKQRKIRLNNFFLQNPNYKKISKFGEMGIQELIDILPDGQPLYYKTYNSGAATTARATSLYNGGSLGLNIQGQGMTAGVWDGGSVRSTHQEFMVGGTSKVLLADGAPTSNHATHVGGTIAAQGISSLSRGLAFNAYLSSYDWTNDLTEMLSEASNGLLASNHSYGPDLSSSTQLWILGAYTTDVRQLDNLCFNNPYYLPIFAAGNSRNDGTVPYSTQIATKNGYDQIAGKSLAKNVLTVAAVEGVTSYTGSSSVTMSSFSSWGPSDDGRIKPDISMKGVNVRSTTDTSDSSYGLMSGTSMAAPGITGVVLLLQQYYNQLYSAFMKSATVKGLILHTADEAGSYTGPDYEFGWGLVNAQKAAIAIKDKNSATTTKSIIEELSLANGATFTKTITASGSTPLKVSISWTDRQGTTVNNSTIDPTSTYLVNDLDVKVTKDDNTYYPWKLQGMSAPSDLPTNTGTNNVDNFERVDIENPSGTYTITVTHKGTLAGGNQNFSLITTSDNLSTLSTNEAISADDSKVNFYPNPAKDYIQINEEDKDLLINIYDVSGKLVITSKFVDNKINISNLNKGNYFANFITKKGEIKNFKFIKE